MDVHVHESERLSNITLRHKLKVREPLVVRKDIHVNEHETIKYYP
jgi:hypothetical protein